MLPKHPAPEHEEPTTSPALARRRDYMLRSEGGRHEPRLVPSADDGQRSLLPQPTFDVVEDEPDPEIPPPPAALRTGGDGVVRRASPAPRRRRLWPLGTAAIVAVVAGGIAWMVYERTGAAPAGGQVPYITADAGPEKIRPQQEGGIDVPNQDIRVYNELNGAKPAKDGEVLLPPPETPVAPPAPAAPAAADKPAADHATAEVPIVPVPPAEVAPAAGANAPASASTAPTSNDKAADTPPANQPAQVATAASAFRIQLAAVKTHDAAQAAWKKLTKNYPDVLKGLKPNIVKVDRGAEGTLFRVQGGPFASRDAAESACSKLKQKSQPCLVVAP
jgi:cell division septation protein DedD